MKRVTPARAIAGSALLFFALALASPLLAQQDPRPVPRREALRVVPYPLESADPEETQALLESLFHGDGPLVRITCDRRTQTVIVYAPDSIHSHVRDLIGTIDREMKHEGGELETRVIAFQHLTVDSLRPVVQLHDVQVATNAATNSLIVRGKKFEIDRLVETLSAIDVATPSVELECWLLEHGRGTQIKEHKELGVLAPELSRAGLENYGVFSYMAVRSLAGEDFDSNQNFVNRRLRNLALEGIVRLVDQGKTAQIEIGISTSMQLGEGEDQGSSGSFELRTELTTQPGKLVVVGLAPTGDESAKPLVLVLRVKK